jgi:hypothetical protein
VKAFFNGDRETFLPKSEALSEEFREMLSNPKGLALGFTAKTNHGTEVDD